MASTSDRKPNRLYAVTENERCIACGYRKDSHEHYLHVPMKNRPPEMQKPVHKKRVAVDGIVYDFDKVPGYVGPDESVSEFDDVSRETIELADTAVLAQLADIAHFAKEFGAPSPNMVCPSCGRVSKSPAGNAAHQRSHQSVMPSEA